jgi:tRNA pseudouridine32 synthase/23S rRNA pseudouridine746 synthase
MKIVFQNENFVIIDKPAEVLSVPGRFKEDDRPVAGLLLQEQIGQRIFPVHRLDFEVSGILVFALNPQAHTNANKWFENKGVTKIYQAYTEGVPPKDQIFEWKSILLRGKKRVFESPHGKSSLTHAEFVSSDDIGLAWILKPITGRSHQLRYECSKHGFPIVGDTLYGSQKSWRDKGIALRAQVIQFPLEAAKFGLPESLSVTGLF